MDVWKTTVKTDRYDTEKYYYNIESTDNNVIRIRAYSDGFLLAEIEKKENNSFGDTETVKKVMEKVAEKIENDAVIFPERSLSSDNNSNFDNIFKKYKDDYIKNNENKIKWKERDLVVRETSVNIDDRHVLDAFVYNINNDNNTKITFQLSSKEEGKLMETTRDMEAGMDKGIKEAENTIQNMLKIKLFNTKISFNDWQKILSNSINNMGKKEGNDIICYYYEEKNNINETKDIGKKEYIETTVDKSGMSFGKINKYYAKKSDIYVLEIESKNFGNKYWYLNKNIKNEYIHHYLGKIDDNMVKTIIKEYESKKGNVKR